MTDASSDSPDILTARRAEVTRFVRARYGLRGTLRLHRAAFGWDLLRAPVNVALAPLFLIIRLLAALIGRLGVRRAGAWLAARQIFLKSNVARRLEDDLAGFANALRAKGLGPKTAPQIIRAEIARHTETRNAVAEITTSLLVMAAGLLIFHRATPGVMSLAGPVARMRVHAEAVRDFTLGSGAGRMWYAVFPVELSPWQVIATGIVLAVIASVVTTFAGLIADPVQLWTGTHRRRLMRLLTRLDHAAPAGGLEREHVLARLGDLSDAALSLWRSLRG